MFRDRFEKIHQKSPVEWVRAKCPSCKRPTGKARHMRNGMDCLTQKMYRITTRSIILGDRILKLGSGDVSGVFLSVIRFLGSPDRLLRRTASLYKKPSADAFSYYEPRRVPQACPSYSCFRTEADGFLKLCLRLRWDRDCLESFPDNGSDYFIVEGGQKVLGPPALSRRASIRII
jgi:hypothetical protein